MKFKERSFYNPEGLRPRPHIYFNEKEKILIVITNWGKKIQPEKIISTLENFLLSSLLDDEATSPFIAHPQLGHTANRLRSGVLLLNEFLFKEYNKEEYQSGIEIFAGYQNQSEFVFTNIGQPHTLLSRNQKNILPIHQNIDLSMDLSNATTVKTTLPPLPSTLVGVEQNIDFEIKSLRPQKNDKLILLSYSWIPDFILSMPDTNRTTDEFFKRMSQFTDQSSWMGILDF